MRARYSLVAIWVGALCAGVGVGLYQPPTSPSEVVFLSVGQGDCTVFRHQGLTIMVDVGPKSESFDAGSRIVAPKLRQMGVERVDMVFLTHPDADHIGGLAGLAQRVRIGKVVAPAYFKTHPDLSLSLTQGGIRRSDVLWIDRDLRFDLRGLAVEVRLPPYLRGMPDNEGSLLIRSELNGRRVVLTGDAGSETELQVLGRADWSADILKAGHHGSKGSSGEAWLREVSPKAIVVSCGRQNRFGHPAPEMLDRADAAAAKVLRTDLEGDIRFRWTQNGFEQVKR